MELYMEKAMILIPYPFAAENHQNINADVLKNENACIKINQNEYVERNNN